MVPLLHDIRDPKELHWMVRPLPVPSEGMRILVWLEWDTDYPPAIGVWAAVAPPNGHMPKHFEWHSVDVSVPDEKMGSVKWWAWLQWPANVIVG